MGTTQKTVHKLQHRIISFPKESPWETYPEEMTEGEAKTKCKNFLSQTSNRDCRVIKETTITTVQIETVPL